MRLLQMKTGKTWKTHKGTGFTEDHPFQLVDDEEAYILLQEPRFKEASRQDLIEFYGIENAK